MKIFSDLFLSADDRARRDMAEKQSQLEAEAEQLEAELDVLRKAKSMEARLEEGKILHQQTIDYLGHYKGGPTPESIVSNFASGGIIANQAKFRQVIEQLSSFDTIARYHDAIVKASEKEFVTRHQDELDTFVKQNAAVLAKHGWKK